MILRNFLQFCIGAFSLVVSKGYEVPSYCANIFSKCECDTNKPLVFILLLDVSRSIDIDDLFGKYIPAVEKTACGLNLAEDGESRSGRDAIGLITFGWDIKVTVPLRRFTHTEWRRQMRKLRRGRRSTRYFAAACCTPLASALEMARAEIVSADAEGRIDATNSRVVVHVVTDGFPVQNRMTKTTQVNKGWTQEKFFPSRYKLQLVPEKANELKDKFPDVTINAFLLHNKKGLDKNEADEYFRGINVVAEGSFKRKAYVKKKIWTSPERIFEPSETFPIVTSPANDHVADVSDMLSDDQIAAMQIDYCCPTQDAIGTDCPASTSPNPTKSPTLSPTKTPTKAPSKTPSKAPTKAPVTGPTTKNPTSAPSKSPTSIPTTVEVLPCGNEKDLIFILDSSNSIAYNNPSNRFRDEILPLAQDLQRIQEDNRAGFNTALITFSAVVRERIPLGQYSYSEFASRIDQIKANSQGIIGCCTPTAEALDMAREILAERTNPQHAIVFVITDGQPFPNKEDYENTPETEYSPTPAPTRPNQVNYRRPGDCAAAGAPPNCKEMTYAEYVSRQVFESAEQLKNTGPLTEVFFVGVPTKTDDETKVDYFIGLEKADPCMTKITTKQNEWVCVTCTSCTSGGTPGDDCWAKQARQFNTCPDSANDFFGSIVSDPVETHSAVVPPGTSMASAVVQMRDLLCSN